MISIIHPSRGRPEKAAATIDKWQSNSSNINHEWILSIDTDDKYTNKYTSIPIPESLKNYVWISNNNRSAVDAINKAAKIATGDLLMVVSDDTDCTPGWDLFLLKWLNGKKDFICKTQDGTQPWIITNPIMDRAYYNRFGYIYHPDYKHMFCDTELTCVADLTGRKLVSNIMFKHNHYSVTKEPPDEISKRADKTWDQGEKLFLERYKRNFDLPPDQIKGKIEDNGMIRWLQKKVR